MTGIREAVFAGGCFWGLRRCLASLPGVLEAVAGYTGGMVENPDYASVCTGATGHREAVRVRYDTSLISYPDLLSCFWDLSDPTNAHGQGPDIGPQYRAAIFCLDDSQLQQAEESLSRLRTSGRYAKPLVTPILPACHFWMAEEEHQLR